MKGYIIRVVAAGIVCAISRAMLNRNTATGKLVNILTGVLLCTTILSPLTIISFNRITGYFDDLSMEADLYSQNGKTASQTKINLIIKSEMEAYILDKAKSMGLEVAVEVELDDDNSVPCRVKITGAISPYKKVVLESYIEETIGISKENQRWI